MTTSTKLTKTRIVKHLESKKAEQLVKLEREIQAKLDSEKIKLLTDAGLVDFYKKWQEHFDLAFKELDYLIEEMTEKGTIAPSYYSNNRTYLRKLSGENKMILRDTENLNFVEERFGAIEDELYGNKNEIGKEWSKLINVVKSMTSVKKIREYLKDLGIDLTELEKQLELEKPMLPSTDIRVDLLKV